MHDRSIPTIVIGAGGHARVVVSILRAQGVNVAGCTAIEAPSSNRWPKDIPYLGGNEVLETLAPGANLFVNGIGSSGRIENRRQVFENALRAGARFRGLIHPSAVIAPDAEIDPTALIMAGAVVQTGAWIGPNVLINTGAIIDHDTRVGAHSHIATGARLAGEVVIGDAVLVGAGATIIQRQEVGAGAVVAAGAVVIRRVAPETCQGGVPAKPLRSRSG